MFGQNQQRYGTRLFPANITVRRFLTNAKMQEIADAPEEMERMAKAVLKVCRSLRKEKKDG